MIDPAVVVTYNQGHPVHGKNWWFGTILPKGRGRCFTRSDYSAQQGSANHALIEWKRRRPYSWRL